MRQMLKLNPILGTKDQFPVAVGVDQSKRDKPPLHLT